MTYNLGYVQTFTIEKKYNDYEITAKTEKDDTVIFILSNYDMIFEHGKGRESAKKNDIEQQCDYIKKFLLEKNKSYGDSALNPVAFFSELSSVERLKVRIDDKLNRLFGGEEFRNEDTLIDLIGYLVLLRIAQGKIGDSLEQISDTKVT